MKLSILIVTLLCFLCSESRITEEELITVSTEYAVITWATNREFDSQIVYSVCNPNITADFQKLSLQWSHMLMENLNDGTKEFEKLVKISMKKGLKAEDMEMFLLEHPNWFQNYIKRDMEEPDLIVGEENLLSNRVPLDQLKSVYDATPTKYHYVKITGLKPGVTYCYQTMSDSQVGSPTLWSPGYFTTLVPPSGNKLFSFATMNDMHVGEKVAGYIVIGGIVLTPGFEWPDEDNPYWKFTNEAAVKGINEFNADFTICKGDVSSDYKKEEYENVKAILSNLQNPWYVLRGNHDRVGNGPDYYKEVFDLNITWYSFDHKDFHFIALDSVNLADGQPKISEEQFIFLENDLKGSQNKKTFLFLHHAVTLEAFIWSIPEEDRDRLMALLKSNPQVVGVFSGHSHRAKVTHDRRVSDLVFAETPSVKEYPMGYVIYNVYEGGYIQTFEKSNCDDCLEWNSITRKEFFRLAPFFLYGSLPDRDFVVSF